MERTDRAAGHVVAFAQWIKLVLARRWVASVAAVRLPAVGTMTRVFLLT